MVGTDDRERGARVVEVALVAEHRRDRAALGGTQAGLDPMQQFQES